MSYQQTIRQSLIVIIVGVACLLLGFTVGWGTKINSSGLDNVSAQERVQEPASATESNF